MLWKNKPETPRLGFKGPVKTQGSPETISYRNAVTFDMGDIPVMVADIGMGERNKLQVILPKGSVGESIIDELKDRLQARNIIFSSGLESSYKELDARHIFVGNGVAHGEGPAYLVSKQQVMLILEEMQHSRGITAVRISPSPELATIENVTHVASLTHAELNRLQHALLVDQQLVLTQQQDGTVDSKGKLI